MPFSQRSCERALIEVSDVQVARGIETDLIRLEGYCTDLQFGAIVRQCEESFSGGAGLMARTPPRRNWVLWAARAIRGENCKET